MKNEKVEKVKYQHNKGGSVTVKADIKKTGKEKSASKDSGNQSGNQENEDK